MRALDIRAQYAHARAAAESGDADRAEALLDCCLQDARACGRSDYETGVQRLPEPFQEDQALCWAWHGGWSATAELEAMRTCRGCSNDLGHPCFLHG